MAETSQHPVECDKLVLRGIECPLNFVKAKIALAKLPVGSVLEVTVDRGEPERNVPRSMRLEGQEVLSECEADGGWRVVVRRVR